MVNTKEALRRLGIPISILALSVGATACGGDNEISQPSLENSVIVDFPDSDSDGNNEMQITQYYDDGTAYRVFKKSSGPLLTALFFCEDDNLVTDKSYDEFGDQSGKVVIPHDACKDDGLLDSSEDELLAPL